MSNARTSIWLPLTLKTAAGGVGGSVCAALLGYYRPFGLPYPVASIIGAVLGSLFTLVLISVMLACAGSMYVTSHPEVFAQWRAMRMRRTTRHTPAQILTFRLMGVSVAEADRLGGANPAMYRWMRQFEHRAGIRIGDEPFRDYPTDWPYMAVTAYQERLRSRFRRHRRMPDDVLRGIAVMGALWNPTNPSVGWSVMESVVKDLATGLPAPSVIGWVLATRAAENEGLLTPADRAYPAGDDDLPESMYRSVQRAYSAHGLEHGWLAVLAGLDRTEQSGTEAFRASLLALAALRGHPVHLVTLAATPTAT